MRYTNSIAIALALSSSASAAAIKPPSTPNPFAAVIAILEGLLTGAENLENLLDSLLPSIPNPTTVHPTLPTVIPTSFPNVPTTLPTGLPTIGLPPISLPSVSLPSFSLPTASAPPISLPTVSIPIPPGPVPTISVSVPTVVPSKGLPPLPVTSSFFPSKQLPPISSIPLGVVPPVPVTSIPQPSTGVHPLDHEQELDERQLGTGIGAGFGAVISGLLDLGLALNTAATVVGNGVDLGSTANQKQVCSVYHDFVNEQKAVQDDLTGKLASLGVLDRLTLGTALNTVRDASKRLTRGLAASVPVCSKSLLADGQSLTDGVSSTLCKVSQGTVC